jgi:hypothetical protein
MDSLDAENGTRSVKSEHYSPCSERGVPANNLVWKNDSVENGDSIKIYVNGHGRRDFLPECRTPGADEERLVRRRKHMKREMTAVGSAVRRECEILDIMDHFFRHWDSRRTLGERRWRRMLRRMMAITVASKKAEE